MLDVLKVVIQLTFENHYYC